MQVDLKNDVALVTGGARGIGRAIVQDLVDNGAAVAIVDVHEENCARAAKEINDAGGTAIGVVCDVSDNDQVVAAVQKTMNRFGKITILVNDAGIGNPQRVITHEQSLETWRKVIDIDLNGMFYVCKAVLPIMVDQKGGRIVNIASVAGLVPLRLQSAYDAAKAGVVNFTRIMAVEYGQYGIRVNTVAPGTMENVTVFYGSDGKTFTPEGKRLLEHVPLGRYGYFSEIAHAVLFLVSPDASYVTGAALPVDGGWVCGYHRDF
ncbi:MAG: SDR family oxidoreductase [candidate division Zixibacteria bacterium]|nr:SDR family oxidoreductase [candidate division Zixibacteria bacterium]